MVCFKYNSNVVRSNEICLNYVTIRNDNQTHFRAVYQTKVALMQNKCANVQSKDKTSPSEIKRKVKKYQYCRSRSFSVVQLICNCVQSILHRLYSY